MFSRTIVRRSFAVRTSQPSRQLYAPRQFTTCSRQLARKDTMDKDDLKPEASEYSKSGSDDQASAKVEETAFDPSNTSPEGQHDAAGAESGGDSNNPLNVSPANTDVSETKGGGGQEGSSAESANESSARSRTSGGGGSEAKSGGGKHGA